MATVFKGLSSASKTAIRSTVSKTHIKAVKETVLESTFEHANADLADQDLLVAGDGDGVDIQLSWMIIQLIYPFEFTTAI